MNEKFVELKSTIKIQELTRRECGAASSEVLRMLSFLILMTGLSQPMTSNAQQWIPTGTIIADSDEWPQLEEVVALRNAGWSCNKIQDFAVVLVGYRDSGTPSMTILRPIEGGGAFSDDERGPAERLVLDVYKRFRRPVGDFIYAVQQTCNKSQ